VSEAIERLELSETLERNILPLPIACCLFPDDLGVQRNEKELRPYQETMAIPTLL